MAFSCALITFDRGKPDGVFFKMKMSPGCVDSPRTYAVLCVWASHDRVKNRKSGSEPYLPLKTLDWIKRGSCHLRRWQDPILSPFCFLDRRALVCSPSKRQTTLAVGWKDRLCFRREACAFFLSAWKFLKTLARLQENITCGSVCGKEEPVCQHAVAAGPARKPDRVTYLGFPCATTLGTALGQQEIQIASGGSC